MTPTSPSGPVIARSRTGTHFVTEEPDGLFYVWSPNLNGVGISWTYAYKTKTEAIHQMRGMKKNTAGSKMKAWDVEHRGRVVNRVYFDNDMTADEVRRSLVDHDGFPADIRVVEQSGLPRGAGGYRSNEDLAWREVYSREYHSAAARGVEPLQAREEASRAAWADYEARTGRSAHSPNPPLWESDDEAEYMRLLDRYDEAMSEAGRLEDEGYTEQARIHRRAAEAAERDADRISRRYTANGSGYYVWALANGSNEPLAEGPWGPYETLESAKTFARIGATEGAHDRAVSLGFDPESASFRIVRRYESGSGERIL